MNRKEQKRLQTARSRLPLGITRRGKQRNVDIGRNINKGSIIDEIRNYEQNGVKYVHRLENNLLPKLANTTQPTPRKKRT